MSSEYPDFIASEDYLLECTRPLVNKSALVTRFTAEQVDSMLAAFFCELSRIGAADAGVIPKTEDRIERIVGGER